MRLLDGRWKLVYTTNAQALAVLSAFRRMPLVNVGDITQIVDGAALTVENKVEVAVPFMLSLSALAGFEVSRGWALPPPAAPFPRATIGAGTLLGRDHKP